MTMLNAMKNQRYTVQSILSVFPVETVLKGFKLHFSRVFFSDLQLKILPCKWKALDKKNER